jgi:hypothetical protein
MVESYLDTIASRFQGAGQEIYSRPLAAGEVIEASLGLREGEELVEMSAAAERHLDIAGLSPEDQRLFERRFLGGLATRLALGSYQADDGSQGWRPFFEMPEAERHEILTFAADAFAGRLSYGLVAARQCLGDALQADGWTAEIIRQADPTGVPHSFVRSQLHGHKMAARSTADRWRRLRHYADVGIGSYPGDRHVDATVGINDVVLAQAFGRNTFTDKELPQVRQMYEAAGCDDLVMWQALSQAGFDPGWSNRALGNAVAVRVMDGVPAMEAVVQWEVAYALWQRDPEAYQRFKHHVHTLWPQRGFYPTVDVKADSVGLMDRLGLYNPQELAHPDMMVRAMGILAKLGVEADPAVVQVPFDPDSTQRQARNASAWKRREILTRVHHLLLGLVRF